jgi:hypothetical protein
VRIICICSSVTGVVAATGGAATALRARAGAVRAALAAVLRRLAVADDFFADFLAVLTDLTDFFLVPAAVLADRVADLVDVLLMAAL